MTIHFPVQMMINAIDHYVTLASKKGNQVSPKHSQNVMPECSVSSSAPLPYSNVPVVSVQNKTISILLPYR